MEGEIGVSLFLIGTGGWLIYLGLSGICEFREAHDEPDDFSEADFSNLFITVIGILLLMGIAAVTLGLLSLIA